jgi:hypothetical protein
MKYNRCGSFGSRQLAHLHSAEGDADDDAHRQIDDDSA